MKNKVWLITIIGIALMAMVTSCGDDGNETACACNPKAHLGIGETCTCGADICTDCTLQVYGELTGNGNNIKIYRSGNVADMTAAVNAFTTTYNGWTEFQKTKLNGKLDEIHILQTNPNTEGYTYVNKNGKKILSVFHEYAVLGADYYLEGVGYDTFTIAQAQSNNESAMLAATAFRIDTKRSV
jgi:hypothetical protein